MPYQPTTNVALARERQRSSNEIPDHASSPAGQLPGDSTTLVSKTSVGDPELPNTRKQQTPDRDNELENTQIPLNSASYDADDEHVSNPPDSSSPPFTAEDVDQDTDVQEPIGNEADVPPPTEETLRIQAVTWMEAVYHDAPNGTAIAPPTWYAPSHSTPSRPRVWIKDFFTGHVRPRRLVNDRLAEMSLVERERWENRQRRIRGEPAE
ncbi:hypothetical protein GE21DRAFT_8675 [Neurospora crassa]|uniref:Uncharacterized protein n=1 Tax=Neurospora crassa (strain ATCC 24698 / 74-OR23-1A / CBS 708.71 / DSM 1257 / FGSC 987) TaxID=367110 RepID=Q7S653_NEUCR|nr:hypothetical protein NCU04707 [Neurospora crassa OR74A]EAA31002.1 hypothetical protein NCU04707 [Neurospora crassa OR74A]KHE83281.1 hypothetical protein GE21DRAFT_8675 [Neurospora crassa]|eukprot:XP_960238.1 hypothetical protein NCU04707 [Neurospora crassa OR74A]